MAQCKSCGAPIVWVKTESGKSMPVDEKPVSDGKVAIRNGVCVVCPQFNPGEFRYNSHFSTCPNAKQHRRSDK